MHLLRTGFLAFAIVSSACASSGRATDATTVADAIRARTGQALRPSEGAATPSALPPDVRIDDGVTQDEAVATALWNSPSFQLTLADLGLARADLLEAGLLRNPILSLLFPWGPKQFEWTLQFPFDAIWQRPRRVAAARLNLESVSQRLVWDAMTLVAEARSAHVDAVIADRRLALTVENAALTRRIADIADARLKAGDISDLEARGARSDASRLDVVRRAVEYDRDLARLTLAGILGLDTPPAQLQPTASVADVPVSCGADEALLKDALATRPDVRAAEIAIEAAGARARWERSRVLTLIGILDGNQRGTEGAEAGPGVNGEIPIFSRNQGGISRAEAELERVSRRYAAVRAQVMVDVRSSTIRLRQAQAVIDAWRQDIVPSLEMERRQAESAYRAGEVPLFGMLDVSRRLVDGRMRLLEAEAALQKALVTLERSIGRSCSPRP
jgi:cobalt-zinc-cadmium efflux system outer membrane protein